MGGDDKRRCPISKWVLPQRLDITRARMQHPYLIKQLQESSWRNKSGAVNADTAKYLTLCAINGIKIWEDTVDGIKGAPLAKVTYNVEAKKYTKLYYSATGPCDVKVGKQSVRGTSYDLRLRKKQTAEWTCSVPECATKNDPGTSVCKKCKKTEFEWGYFEENGSWKAYKDGKVQLDLNKHDFATKRCFEFENKTRKITYCQKTLRWVELDKDETFQRDVEIRFAGYKGEWGCLLGDKWIRYRSDIQGKINSTTPETNKTKEFGMLIGEKVVPDYSIQEINHKDGKAQHDSIYNNYCLSKMPARILLNGETCRSQRSQQVRTAFELRFHV